jgi:RNA polymerase primary sigma factor/RNA polymerase sporulation-specific sigma factor
MSNEELVGLYQEGDPGALEVLLQNNQGLVYEISKRFYTQRDNAIDKEDLIQEGCIGLMKAAAKYSADKGALFTTYASYWIYQSMHRFMYPTRQQMLNKGMYLESLNECIPNIDANMEKIDSIPNDDFYKYTDIEERLSSKQDWNQIKQIISNNRNVNNRAFQILKMEYGLDETQTHTLEEIANSLGVSVSRIGRIRNDAFREIKKSRWFKEAVSERRVVSRKRSYDRGIFDISSMCF